jgi:hypothetical protein
LALRPEKYQKIVDYLNSKERVIKKLGTEKKLELTQEATELLEKLTGDGFSLLSRNFKRQSCESKHHSKVPCARYYSANYQTKSR